MRGIVYVSQTNRVRIGIRLRNTKDHRVNDKAFYFLEHTVFLWAFQLKICTRDDILKS